MYFIRKYVCHIIEHREFLKSHVLEQSFFLIEFYDTSIHLF